MIRLGKSFTSLSQLEAYLTQKITESLNTSVAEQVKEELQTAVSETVYSAGTPLIYERRGGNSAGGMGNSIGTGSLSDPNEMRHTVDSGILEVWDEAKPSAPWDQDLTSAIVYGYNDKSHWWDSPRDFIETARENMQESKSHVHSLADGLRKLGLTVIES